MRPGNIIVRQKGTQWHPGENVPSASDNSDEGAYGKRFHDISF